MQTLDSNYTKLCNVQFPEFQNRQYYMHTTPLFNPDMPAGFEDYVPLLINIYEACKLDTLVHVTIDEKIVPAGMSQRRPKPHVDGRLILSGDGTSIEYSANTRWGPGWNHYCNQISLGNWLHDTNPTSSSWIHKISRMAVIVAGSVPGCRAWEGRFIGNPKDDGDLTHISDQLGNGEILEENTAYLFSPDCVHESMIFEVDTPRQFIRLAIAD